MRQEVGLSKLTKVGAGPHYFTYTMLSYSNQSECSICGI